MGAPAMIEGPKDRLIQAVHNLTNHQLTIEVIPDGWSVHDGRSRIHVGIADDDDTAVMFLTFSYWNPLRWLRAGRLIEKVEQLVYVSLKRKASQ